jgi:hypothetical protein
MTNETQAPGRLSRARAAFCALAKRAGGWLSEAQGWLGLALLCRGLWLQYGEAWALVAAGSILLAVSLASTLRGDG